MEKEQFLALVMKVLSGNHTPEEEALMQATMRAEPEFNTLYQQMQRYWTSSRPQPSIQVEKRLQQTWDKINRESTDEASITPSSNNEETTAPLLSESTIIAPRIRHITGLRKWSAIAACMAITVGSCWLMLHYLRSKPAPVLVEKHNPKGVRSNIILSDGTVVWLNANSTLRYENIFSTGERVVYLEGEAFFTVAQQASRPFLVKVPHGTVQVLGTSFNVNSFPETGTIQTAVESGKVAFIPAYNNIHAADTFYLTHQQKAVFNLANEAVNVMAANTAEDKAWINGTLIFHGNSLQEIAVILERAYGKPVEFRNERVKQYRYTGIFNNTASDILYILSKTKHFDYSISDSLITIGE